jgi:site-specific DNA recombinase
MKSGPIGKVRCAIYTRVSTDQGLDQDFNSLDAQYEASSAYIKSQVHAGWTLIRSRYDDGGYSGGSTDRPNLQQLLDDVRARKIDVIVVYKVDRLTRSLADFAKLVELFDARGVTFISVTQQFKTTTSMGRLTLNVLLSFAQFEREVTSERIRDKIAASKRKGACTERPEQPSLDRCPGFLRPTSNRRSSQLSKSISLTTNPGEKSMTSRSGLIAPRWLR